MKPGSVVAIFFLFWCLSFFLVLPFRLQRRSGPDEGYVPGSERAAPPRFSFARTCLWTTIVAAGICGLFFLNYVEGWLPAASFDFVPESIYR